MKSLIITLISLSSLSTFASRIPVCTMTFGGTSQGSGIYKPMHQDIRGSLYIYDYNFDDIRIDARFNLATGSKGMIMMIDKASGRVLSNTYASLVDGKDEEIEAYLDLNKATYQVECKYEDQDIGL